jgi:hypothetical protein
MFGRTIANGYGKEHKALRAEFALRMASGELFRCWRCTRLINPAAPWDLGHDDTDRSIYRGPEHVGCNRSPRARRQSRRGTTGVPRRSWML